MHIVKQRDPTEIMFRRMLVEDKVCPCLPDRFPLLQPHAPVGSQPLHPFSVFPPAQLNEAMSYVDYLCLVHKEIQNAL